MHLNKINFVGVKLFRTPDFLQKNVFQMQRGRRLLDRQAAQGHRAHEEAVRRIRLHRFRAGAFVRSHPRHRQDRPDAHRRRRQAVLRAPHRFHRQHHHARQSHPPRDSARRRRHFNSRLVGVEHPAPEPARLLRSAQSGRGGHHQAQHADQHGGYHAQGEGARQEFNRLERRRFGHRRQLRRLQLFDQQLPRPGRDAVARVAARHPHAQCELRLHRAVLPRQAHPGRLRGLHAPLQLRSGARSFDSERAESDPAVPMRWARRTC